MLKEQCKVGDWVYIRDYDDPIAIQGRHLNLPRSVWENYNGIGKICEIWSDRAIVDSIVTKDGARESWFFYFTYLEPIPIEHMTQFDMDYIEEER